MASLDPKDLKPQNVSEVAAETFLLATGWAKRGDQWLSPLTNTPFPRGQAVVRQFQQEFVRLTFLIQHMPPEFLLLLIPPVVVEQIKETVEKMLAEHIAKSAEANGPAN